MVFKVANAEVCQVPLRNPSHEGILNWPSVVVLCWNICETLLVIIAKPSESYAGSDI